MKAESMGLRAKIRNLSNKTGIDPYVIQQNFMMESFLKRLARSKYHENFVVKGGFLVASIVGIQNRATMDLDTSLRGVELNQESILQMFNDIISIDHDDDILITVKKVRPIREEDQYGGYRVSANAQYFSMSIPLKFDLSTGDAITPNSIIMKYRTLLTDEEIALRSYNIETILAEKIQAMFSRGVTNTRMRDFYDVFILTKFHNDKINYAILGDAMQNTNAYRETPNILDDWREDIAIFENDEAMNELWAKFANENVYSRGISFSDVCEAAKALLEKTTF